MYTETPRNVPDGSIMEPNPGLDPIPGVEPKSGKVPMRGSGTVIDRSLKILSNPPLAISSSRSENQFEKLWLEDGH